MRHSSLSSQIYKTSFLFAKSQIEEEFLVNRYLHMSIIAIKIFAHQNKKCATLHIKIKQIAKIAISPNNF